YWSLWIFLVLFLVTLFAEFISNDRPYLVWYKGQLYTPVFTDYIEDEFGGDLGTIADYRDPYIAKSISDNGWMLWPPLRYSWDTINYDVKGQHPAPPSPENWLGTDQNGRDVLARVMYGFRISVLFGLALTVLATPIGLAIGALQGYFGGWLDLVLQRVIEIWSGLPTLFLLIILASLVQPGFWWLLGIMVLFEWISLVSIVRAEFLRTRNFDYVRAARALGAGDVRIMVRHILPNAMVATLSYLPFVLSGAITMLTALDFLGLGMPVGSPSLGELLSQGKANLQAPWLGLTAFAVLGVLLSLLVFIGEAVRDAFDPRKVGL
ncbi:MAG: ABC transporter permease, partial [Pseudomonadota bacterium]|nr:ABC transporter permease [Pseudomonadota bacterium]